MRMPGKHEEPGDDFPRDPFYQPKNGRETFRLNLYFWLQALIAALVTLILVFTFVGRIIGVQGPSMLPTLHQGDMMVLQGIGYHARQGDVVVLTQQTFRDTPIVKRVIALGGQTVDIDYDTNSVYVDGVKLDEPYINEPMVHPSWHTTSHIEVPEGSVCVFGDNRNHSTDSRSPDIGTVDERCILGRAVLVLFPFRDFGVIH